LLTGAGVKISDGIEDAKASDVMQVPKPRNLSAVAGEGGRRMFRHPPFACLAGCFDVANVSFTLPQPQRASLTAP
jgi:hypothetical protein